MAKVRKQGRSRVNACQVDMPYGSVAETLRLCREAAGLSRAELADRSGVSLSAIRSIEVKDTLDPLMDTIVALSTELGLKVDQLVGLMPLSSQAVSAGGPQASKK